MDAQSAKVVELIMSQAQVFASAWSLVGGRFDQGGELANAVQQKSDLHRLVSQLANVASPAPVSAPGESDPQAIARRVCQVVADMDDRTSPEDWPEAMLVTGEELFSIVVDAIASERAEPATAPRAPQGVPA